jgi:hypothetical protein
MLWIGAAVMVAGGMVALLAMVFSKRGDDDELGAVSNRWIAEHRADLH